MHHPPTQQTQSAQQPTASDQRGSEQSPAFVRIIPTPKTDAEAAQDASERQERANSDKWLIRWTAAVAAFTLVLAAVGAWQGIQLKRTVDLARSEFFSSHRPRMRLKHMRLLDERAWRLGGPFEVTLDIVNIGNTAGDITWINYASIILPTGINLPQRPPYDEEPFGPEMRITRFRCGIRLPSGVTYGRTVCDGLILDDTQVRAVLWGESQLYLVGTIEYVDAAGVRQTAFCRHMVYNRYPPEVEDMGNSKFSKTPITNTKTSPAIRAPKPGLFVCPQTRAACHAENAKRGALPIRWIYPLCKKSAPIAGYYGVTFFETTP